MTESDREVAAELRALSGIDALAPAAARRSVLDARARRARPQLLESEVRSCLDELAGPDRALVAALGGGDPAAAAARAEAELAEAERCRR